MTAKLALAGILAAGLTVPAQANAQPEPSRDRPLNTRMVQDSLGIARDFFRAVPSCPGGMHVYASDDLARFADPARPTLMPVAVARMDECVMWLSPEAGRSKDYGARIYWCSVIAHEYGHWMGHGHSTSPSSAMYHRSDQTVVRGCYRRFKPKRVTRVDDRFQYGPRTWATP